MFHETKEACFVKHMLISAISCFCKQACNTSYHINQRRTGLFHYLTPILLLRQFVSSDQFFRYLKTIHSCGSNTACISGAFPAGYKPLTELSNVSPLGIRTGEEVRLSTPAKIASGRSNPLIFLPKLSIPSMNASESSFVRIFLRSAN